MTLNTKNRVFKKFGDFWLGHTFRELITPKSLEIDKDSPHTKCSALNVNFNSASFELLSLKKIYARGHQRWVLL